MAWKSSAVKATDSRQLTLLTKNRCHFAPFVSLTVAGATGSPHQAGGTKGPPLDWADKPRVQSRAGEGGGRLPKFPWKV